MAESAQRPNDDDVTGHEFAKEAEAKKRAPGESAARPEDDDDVRGHEAARAPEQGKKGAPGESA